MLVSVIICECQSSGFVWMEDKTKQAYWIGQSGPIELLSAELTKSCSKMKEIVNSLLQLYVMCG